jgi:Xaa-Pro aminopeptidase
MMNRNASVFNEIQAFRDQLHASQLKITAGDLSCVVYVFDTNQDHYYATGYRGCSKNPAFKYRFHSAQFRSKTIEKWMKKQSLSVSA